MAFAIVICVENLIAAHLQTLTVIPLSLLIFLSQMIRSASGSEIAECGNKILSKNVEYSLRFLQTRSKRMVRLSRIIKNIWFYDHRSVFFFF